MSFFSKLKNVQTRDALHQVCLGKIFILPSSRMLNKKLNFHCPLRVYDWSEDKVKTNYQRYSSFLNKNLQFRKKKILTSL